MRSPILLVCALHILAACDSAIVLPDAGPSVDAGTADAGGPLVMCDNDVRDPNETGVDCGGVCSPCPPGEPFESGADCTTSVCNRSRCHEATCRDG
ncbi:MAG: hypothetical protein AB7P00_26195, partial [Sandaracinaceae bacterium]